MLERRGTARHGALTPGVRPGQALLTADIDGGTADSVLAYLSEQGLALEDVSLSRVDDVGPIAAKHPAVSLIWADVLGQASRNARPVARYLVFMVVAGVIAGFGVIYANSTLIVGAMAVSPDTLPVTAICAGVVGHRWRLAARALLTLGVGLLGGDVHRGRGRYRPPAPARRPSRRVSAGQLGCLGADDDQLRDDRRRPCGRVAAILAVETRASAAVGVGISVTTVPYLRPCRVCCMQPPRDRSLPARLGSDRGRRRDWSSERAWIGARPVDRRSECAWERPQRHYVHAGSRRT